MASHLAAPCPDCNGRTVTQVEGQATRCPRCKATGVVFVTSTGKTHTGAGTPFTGSVPGDKAGHLPRKKDK